MKPGAANAVTPPTPNPGTAAPAAAPDKAGAPQGGKPVATPVVNAQPPAPGNLDAKGGGKSGGAVQPAPAGDGKPGDAPVAKEDPKLAARFAALTNREVETRKGEEKLASERKAFEQERKSLEQEFAPFRQLATTAKTDPVEAFRVIAGLPDRSAAIKALVKAAAGKKETAEERVERLEREREEEKNQQAERERNQQVEQRRRAAEAAQARAEQDAVQIVTGDPEKFDLLNREEKVGKGRSGKLVWAVMDAHYKATFNPETKSGEVLSIEQAVQMCEDGLAERVRRLMDSPKFKANDTAAPAPAPAAEAPGKAAPKAPAVGQQNATPEDDLENVDESKLTRTQQLDLAERRAKKRKAEREKAKAGAAPT